MTSWINKYRLYNQQLTNKTKFKSPREILKWFCGIQGQDYYSAKFAMGVRLSGSTEADIDEAIENMEIVRSWPMRGTLHFVAAEDIHWLFDLLAPGSKKAFKSRNRQLGLEDRLLKKCNVILVKILEGKNQLTREEITLAFADEGIWVNGIQLSHILNNAALEKLICFGVMRGKKFTFTLLDEWIKSARPVKREEARAEIARRYFLSRGPATLKDFIWWSGLPVTEARLAIHNVSSEFTEEIINGVSFWFKDISENLSIRKTILLPAFDEYLIGYKDRSSMLDPMFKEKAIFINGIFNPVIVLDGIVLGMWKRIFNNKGVVLRLDPFINYTPQQHRNIEKQAEVYGRFLGKEVQIELNI